MTTAAYLAAYLVDITTRCAGLFQRLPLTRGANLYCELAALAPGPMVIAGRVSSRRAGDFCHVHARFRCC